MLNTQVLIALLSFLASICFTIFQKGSVVAGYHIIFAIGILPLILAAMSYFTPVLTRSKQPKYLSLIPITGSITGILVAGHFIHPEQIPDGHYIAACIDTIITLIFGYWAYNAGVKAIGKPHACLNWYLAAIACLLMGLGAILLSYAIPEQRPSLRLFHLHINTLGFIGITAIGTLQVLLPTIAFHPDILAAERLNRHLKWILGGTLLVAGGAAWLHELVWIGLGLLTIPIASLFDSWRRLYLGEIFSVNGAPPILVAALCGYTISLLFGAMHATSHHITINPVFIFIIAFLIPLVMGAVSHLLPLWLCPGPQTPWHIKSRNSLALGGGLRGTLLLASGVMVGLGYEIGWYLAIFTLAVFFLQILYVVKALPLKPNFFRKPLH